MSWFHDELKSQLPRLRTQSLDRPDFDIMKRNMEIWNGMILIRDGEAALFLCDTPEIS